MKPLACLVLLAALISETAYCEPSLAPGIPMPRPRPAALNGNGVPADKFLNDPDLLRIPDPDPPGVASDCQTRMSKDVIAIFQSVPAITRAARGCGAIDVVKLETIILPDNARITMSPPAIMRCTMAEAISKWVREEIAPAFAKAGPPMRVLDNYASYDCRGRNNIASAKTSEHGFANAIDIRGVRLADGKFVQWTDRSIKREFREELRRDACAKFTTVLGPGSDGYHEEHIHLDLAERRGGYRLCQWDVLDPVPEVPLPRPRPKGAPKSADATPPE